MTESPSPVATLSLKTYSDQPEVHDHAFHQVVFARTGVLEIEVDGRGGWVDGRRGVFVGSGTAHAFFSRTANRFWVLDVTAGLQDADTVERLREAAFFPIGPGVQPLLEYADRLDPAAVTAATASAWATLLFSALAPPLSPGPRGSRIVGRAVAFMRGELAHPLTSAAIARAAGTSERRLYALFQQHLGCTPHAHLSALRLGHAADLLEGGDLAIAEIARRSGFADQSTLTRALKHARGITPAALRRLPL